MSHGERGGSQVTPLATTLSKLPYPIPPAGGDIDPNAAAAPPMGLTFPLPPNVIVLDAATPEVRVQCSSGANRTCRVWNANGR
jgi:hypothetical protein